MGLLISVGIALHYIINVTQKTWHGKKFMKDFVDCINCQLRQSQYGQSGL
jgi:hypothetical protein